MNKYLKQEMAGLPQTFPGKPTIAIELNKPAACKWYQGCEEECGEWEAVCYTRRSFVFNDGGPQANGFRFCPYCGMPLEEIPYEEEDDDE